jgi:peptidoglycan/LPS O-acetylase OafA/YrhL
MEDVEQRRTNAPEQTASLRPAKQSGYIPSLDGWRAIAILWVIEGHCEAWNLGPFNNHWLRETPGRAVQLFFALSGYLICTRLLREEERFGSISLRSFYTRRVFRIQPAAMTYLAVLSLLMLLGTLPHAWKSVLAAAAMVRNIFPQDSQSWETGHFWSLAVEEHFYLFLPGFLLLVKRYRTSALAILAVASLRWRLYETTPQRLLHVSPIIYLRTDIVMGGILLGSVFALLMRKPEVLKLAKAWLHPYVALLYAAAVFVRVEFHHGRMDETWLVSVYPILIVSTALHPETLVTKFLELAPIRFLGRISYGLYLWQELFFDRLETPAPHSLRSHAALCWLLLFTIAIASYYFIETPLIRIGHRMAKKFDLQELRENQAKLGTA